MVGAIFALPRETKKATIMIDVVLANGCLEEVADATSAAIESNDLVCRNAVGKIVRVFGHLEAIMYGPPKRILELLNEAESQDPNHPRCGPR